MHVTPAPYTLKRLGIIMEPEPGNASEAWGVLNPASARLADGKLLLYPRAVAEGNYSRIEIVDVSPSDGAPQKLERRGFALEPREKYERDRRSHSGVEDPRVTYIGCLSVFVMTYVALGRLGPRVALAVSKNGFKWTRMGLLSIAVDCGIDFDRSGNKDAALFPAPVKDWNGEDALAVLHRPTFMVHNDDGTVRRAVPAIATDERESIWISFISLEKVQADLSNLAYAHDSHELATPKEDWESLKIGAGTPPILTKDGWLTFYHGVSGHEPVLHEPRKDVCYEAGAMLLDRENPNKILYRSAEPVLRPDGVSDDEGINPNVVFPTAVDVQGRQLYVFYGSADTRIGLATTELDSDPLIAPSSAVPAESGR